MKFPRWSHLGLHAKAMMLAIAIGTIPVSITGGTAYYFANQSLSSDITADQQERVISFQDKVNRFMRERFSDIQVMASLDILVDPTLRTTTTAQAKAAALNRIAVSYGVYDSIAIFDLQGNVIAQTTGTPLSNHFDRTYIQAALETNGAVIGQPAISTTEGTFNLYFASTLKDPETQQPIGFIRARMPVKFLEDIIKTYGKTGTQYYLINADGEIFIGPEGLYVKPILTTGAMIQPAHASSSSSTQSKYEAKDAALVFPVLQQLQNDHKPHTVLATNAERQMSQLMSYASAQSLVGLPDLGWHTIIATDSAIAFAPQRQLLSTLLVGTGVTALGVSAIAVYIASRFTRPILKATHAVQQIGQGNLDTRLPIQGDDELARLSQNINDMAHQIQTLMQTQEDYNLTLENTISDRTQELRDKNGQLQQTLQNLKRTQTQLIQTEKMSSLGQLVAGVAHEINNPVNFIYGNLTHAETYMQDLLSLVQSYQDHIPDAPSAVQDMLEETDFDFLQDDFPRLMASMRVGSDRIRQIVSSLRTFSRLDEAEHKDVDIHEGLDSTLMILGNRLKAKTDRPEIQVTRDYTHLPLIKCYPGPLNQVFMNLLSNAIDALDEQSTQRSAAELAEHPAHITLRTKAEAGQVKIWISDNGPGMPESVQHQIYDPFFTTKPVGKGTGMGLAISYQIVTEMHGGSLQCFSIPNQGTEFLIELPI